MTTADDVARPGRRGTRLRHLGLVAAMMPAAMLSALDMNVVATALPTIAGELGRVQLMSWVVTAYLLTSVVSTALCGKLSDLYGAKLVYLSMIGLFAGASLLVGLSQDMGQIIAARALQGLGAGGLTTMAFTIIGRLMPPREIGRYQGFVGAVYAVAALGGPLLGGVFTQYLSWRWAFYINVPIGLAAIVVAAVWVRPPRARREGEIDYLGMTLFVAALVSLVLLTVWGGRDYAWTSPTIVVLAVLAVLSAALFVVRERVAPEPILPPRLFRAPGVALSLIITFVAGAAMLGALVYLPLYLQVVQGLTPAQSGLHLAPMMAAVMVGSGVSGWAIAASGRYKSILIAGVGLMAVSMYLFSRLGPSTPDWTVWGYEAVMGTGLGFVISKLIIVVQNVVAERDLGAATSAVTLSRMVGSALGTTLLGAVLTARLSSWQRGLPQEALAGVSGGNATTRLFAEPESIRRLESVAPVAYQRVQEVFADALQTVFLVGVPVALVAFVLSLFLPVVEMRRGDPAAADSSG